MMTTAPRCMTRCPAGLCFARCYRSLRFFALGWHVGAPRRIRAAVH